MAVLIALLAVHEAAYPGKIGFSRAVLALIIEHQAMGIGGIGGSGSVVAHLVKGSGRLGVLPGGKQLYRIVKRAGWVL